MHSDKITARQLGEARATHVPASYIAADFAKIDPTAPLPGRRSLFDMNTAEGRAAHDAFHAARAEVEDSKNAAFERAGMLSRVPHMRAEIARIVREGCGRAAEVSAE